MSKQLEVLNSVLFNSATDEDKMAMMEIAAIGDKISKDVQCNNLSEESMVRYITLHLSALESITNTEIRELLCKASYAEAIVETEKVSKVFGDETYKLFMSGLREIGQF